MSGRAQVGDNFLSGEIFMPYASDAAAIEEAIAQSNSLQRGDMVYEVSSREVKGDTLRVRYRALPRREWSHFVRQPRASWPFIPREERQKDRAAISRGAEMLLLFVFGLALALGALWQTLDAVCLTRYAARLQNANIAVSLQTVGPMSFVLQERWAVELNLLVRALTPLGAEIKAFEFSTTNNSITIVSKKSTDDEIEEALTKTLAPKIKGEVIKIKEGTWAWRE